MTQITDLQQQILDSLDKLDRDIQTLEIKQLESNNKNDRKGR